MQVDFSIEQYHDAAERLRDCLTKENLESINKIVEKEDTLYENQLACGIGVHIIKKLSGRATVDRSKLIEQCPCGCDDKADSGAMWIGKEMFCFLKPLVLINKYFGRKIVNIFLPIGFNICFGCSNMPCKLSN